MTAQQIANAVVTRMGNTSCSIWTVGITQDLVRRKSEHLNDKKNVTHWTQWQADSLSDAQRVESHFINKGMTGGTGGDMASSKTTYVYIF